MRFFVVLAIVIVLILFYYYIHITNGLQGIDYKIRLNNIDFTKFNLSDYTKEGAKVLTDIQIELKNSGNLSLTFKNLRVEVYYNNVLVTKTSDKLSNNRKITILKNSNTVIVQEFIFYINKSTINLIANLASKPVLEYKIQVNWFGFNISQQVTNAIK